MLFCFALVVFSVHVQGESRLSGSGAERSEWALKSLPISLKARSNVYKITMSLFLTNNFAEWFTIVALKSVVDFCPS